MSSLLRSVCLPVLLIAVTACGTHTGPQVGDHPSRRDNYHLTRNELTATSSSDAFQAVRALRPHWLRKRGTMSILLKSDIAVYLDGVQIGGPEALRSVPLTTVRSIRFLDASSATQRWGTNHVHGAIVVQTM